MSKLWLALLALIPMAPASMTHLDGVDNELVSIVSKANIFCPEFIIIDGLRTVGEQEVHYANGASQTMQSKHLIGRAIDFMPVSRDWEDIKGFTAVGECFKSLSSEVIWGGDWTTLRDYGHIELKDK